MLRYRPTYSTRVGHRPEKNNDYPVCFNRYLGQIGEPVLDFLGRVGHWPETNRLAGLFFNRYMGQMGNRLLDFISRCPILYCANREILDRCEPSINRQTNFLLCIETSFFCREHP